MKKQNKPIANSDILCGKAESLSKKKEFRENSQLSDVEFIKLIHELEVHQIGLGMQNDNLVEAKEGTEVAYRKYSELYGLDALAFFIRSNEGEIFGNTSLWFSNARQKTFAHHFLISPTDDII